MRVTNFFDDSSVLGILEDFEQFRCALNPDIVIILYDQNHDFMYEGTVDSFWSDMWNEYEGSYPYAHCKITDVYFNEDNTIEIYINY